MIKNFLRSVLLPSAALLALMPATDAHGAVSLILTDNDATPQAASVARGGAFTVTLKLNTTSEPVTGVDYYLQAAGAAAGKLRLIARDLTGSSLPDTAKLNTGDNGANAGVLDNAVSLLNPANTLDLGGSATDVSKALAAGTYTLATYTIMIDPTTAPGTYTLSTTSLAGTGVVGAAPLFNETSFNQQASFSLTVTSGVGTVVPEPAGLSLVLAGMLPLVRRRRK